MPTESKGRRDLFAKYDFISRLNCLDLYFDTSQVEGWGLPICEAMACGVPTCIPNDFYVRHEMFSGGAYEYPSIPIDLWDTWHTGVRLVQIEPEVAASVIVGLYKQPEFRKVLGDRGMNFIKKYSWDKAREEMIKCLE